MQFYLTSYCCYLSILVFLSFNSCCNDCGFNYSQQEKVYRRHAVLIISSVDGNLYGINAENGEVIWNIKNPPLVSQSLSKLEFVKDGKKFRLIPSLEGQLYMLEIDGGNDNGLRALPITADALFSSTFQLSSDSLLVGGKDQRVFGFNPFSGEVKYRCGKDGCEQDASFPQSKENCDLLICRRISHVVRAVDLESGHEKWNFSVGQDDVVILDSDSFPQSPLGEGGAVIHGGCLVIQDGGKDPGNIGYSFNVEVGEIEAVMKPPFYRVLWKQRINASLSRGWLIEEGTVRQLALFAGDSHGRIEQISDEFGCPRRRSLFLGSFQGHMYVQLEDGNARSAPKPRYVPLSNPESSQTIIDSSLSKRHRVAKLTRHETTALQHGFFRPPAKDLIEPSDVWFIQYGKDEYYPPSTEPLVVRYGSFLFQKFVLIVLILVIGHLLLTKIYIPYQLQRGKHSINLSIALNCSTTRALLAATSPVSRHSPSPLDEISEINTDRNTNPSSNANPNANTNTNNVSHYESRYNTDYEHIRCLGKGAFGVVFEARHRVDQYSYAVKRVRVRYSDQARAKLLQEVQAFAHLEHPGIVRYYQAWFELPPEGWQEKKDKEMGLENLYDGDMVMSTDTNEEQGEDSSQISDRDSTRCTTTSDWSRNSLLTRDTQDSLIIFDRSALPSGDGNNNNMMVTTRSSVPSSSCCSASNINCSHIYLYISMHLYSPRSLKDWLQEQQGSTIRPANHILLHIFAQIVDAVAYLHSNGLMHRDLKPSNILFDNQNHIRIVDFGLATSLLRSKPSPSGPPPPPPHQDGRSSENSNNNNNEEYNYSLTSNVGTELYMSPEQQEGTHYDQKVDVFSLGIIFIELIVPLSTAMERAIVLSRARKSQFDQWIIDSFPAEVSFACRMLNHDPSKRPSCEQLFEDRVLADVIDDVRTRQRLRSASLLQQ